jgi:hypothetical protein
MAIIGYRRQLCRRHSAELFIADSCFREAIHRMQIVAWIDEQLDRFRTGRPCHNWANGNPLFRRHRRIFRPVDNTDLL